MLAISVLPGCGKLEELTEGKKEGESSDKAEAKDGEETKTADATKADQSPKDEGGDKVADAMDAAPAVVEPIPVEPLHTGLDLMLKLVPANAEYMVARDAMVVADYIEEGTRFLDGPLAKLKTGSFKDDKDLRELEDGFDELKGHTDKVVTALKTSGVDLKEGAALVKVKKDSFIIFHASDPNALVEVGKATGESEFADLKCKAIDTHPGFNVCADTQKAVDSYKPGEDPAARRTTLGENLPGVDLDEANFVAHLNKGKKDEVFMAMTTIPGSVHLAMNMPGNDDMVEIEEGMEPGPAKTLAQIQPGAGFVWARLSPKMLEEATKEAKGTPGEGAAKSLTGEFVLAGSVDPGGLIMQVGTTDAMGLEGLLGLGFEFGKDSVPKEIPEIKGSKVLFEKVEIEGGGKKAQSLHLGVSGVGEADVLKSFTGLHADAWAFAANDAFTFAVGPDKDHVGKLLDVSTGGPSTETLESLPKPLAEGLGRNEVGMIVHMPVDFLQGAQMHKLARSALKELSEPTADDVLALAALMAPFSSATMWIAKPGPKPVIHVAMQSIGNRETDEGRAALDAAHTVADGGDPAVAFTELATKYAASPMAWAYQTRAGTDGPGYMVGSGVGAALAATAVAVPLLLGSGNANLADDLGVKPEDPEPELKPTTKPKQPKTKTKPKADPKADPKPADPKRDDPKEPKQDPIVEPKPKPLPPKPTPDPSTPVVKPKPPNNVKKRPKIGK